MASDEDYMAFLDKANRDPSEGYAKPQSGGGGGGGAMEFKTTEDGVEMPKVLKEATKEAFYVSDADEPFVPFALGFKGQGLPDEEEFAKLIAHPDPAKAEVEIMDPVDWDREGQYKDVIDAVVKAGKGNDVRVYRVAKSSTKIEYWLVTTTDQGSLVGVKALAVES